MATRPYHWVMREPSCRGLHERSSPTTTWCVGAHRNVPARAVHGLSWSSIAILNDLLIWVTHGVRHGRMAMRPYRCVGVNYFRFALCSMLYALCSQKLNHSQFWLHVKRGLVFLARLCYTYGHKGKRDVFNKPEKGK